MKRREFIIGTSALASIWSRAALAQSTTKIRRIGVIHVGVDHIPETLEGLREGLRALGYDLGSAPMPRGSTVVAGSNLILDWRNLEDEAAVREAARELVRDHADLIVAVEDQSLRGVRAAASEVPVVFLQVPDPVAEGFVKSLAQPGGNLTGFADFFIELVPKRLELLHGMVPELRRLLVLFDAADPAFDPLLQEVRKATGTLKIVSVEMKVREREDIERVFGSLNPGDAQAVFIASGTLTTRFPTLILKLATERKLVVPFHRRAWAIQGALFSYGPNYPALGRAAAAYVDKVLRGTKPADLPVQRATQMELIVNLKTARAFGLTIPASILAQADEVIE